MSDIVERREREGGMGRGRGEKKRISGGRRREEEKRRRRGKEEGGMEDESG